MNVDWIEAHSKLSTLTDEERSIVEMLIAGDTLVDIARVLDQHRSMVWRKVEKIKKKTCASTGPVSPD